MRTSKLTKENLKDLQKESKELLKTRDGRSHAVISTKGAMLIEWKIDKRNIFFPDQKVPIEGENKKRGGSPICFPIFGSPKDEKNIYNLTKHGFLRNHSFHRPYTAVNNHFCQYHDTISQGILDYDVKASYKVCEKEIYEDRTEFSLRQELRVKSRQQEKLPLCFAFHPYFKVDWKYFSLKIDDKPKHLSVEQKNSEAWIQATPFLFKEKVTVQLSERLSIIIRAEEAFKTKKHRFYIWTDSEEYICVEPVMHDPHLFGTKRGYYIGPEEKKFAVQYTAVIKNKK